MEFRQAVRPEVALPYRAGTLPPRAAAFQHRETTDLLAQTLESGNAAVLTSDSVVRTGVVSGLGGVGKTQVAVDYAERVWVAGEVELMVWVTAGSREAIISTCARVAADVTGVQDADPQLGARRLMEWLASTSARWLIVLDDVQNPGDLRGLWPPATATGRVVVTTRRRDAALRGYGRRQIEVGVFTPHAAHDYLQAALADQPHLLDRAGELAGALGYLPLALAQAGAYMRDRNLPCAAYRDRLADRRRRLATLVPEPDGLPDEHQATVAATWSLSIEQANRLEPEGVAGLLLEVASMLDANGIPADVFMTPAVTDLLTSTLGRDVDAEQARDGLGCLHRLSLINLDPGSIARAVRIHALVQRVVRDTLPSRRLPIVVHAAADALLQIWPYVERDTALGQVLRANADALSEAGGQHLWEPDGHKVLFRAGNSLGQTGLVAEARDYFDRQRITAQKHHGSDHPDTLITRRHIAYWRGKAG
ncbi:NB-ARC domain-containing protein, partial [Actinocrispum wychmicini]|uniref:NB-ARC domain-containing protein n=1 Tax=Actinocrispum wychmicini TaxID=1213861 RepID=UPI00140502B7